MRTSIMRAMACIAIGASIAAGHAEQQKADFHIRRIVPLGGDGSWDYLRFDESANRLFVTRSTRVMVVDLATGKLIGEIPDTAGVHGVALAPELHRGVTSNGKANTASIFDLDSLKVVATLPTGEKPDSILWEPFSKLVLTMNGASNSISELNLLTAKSVGAIPLPGRPETAVADGKGKVFVNLEDKAQIAEVDMVSHTVLYTWDLTGCTEPTGLAIDEEHARLFSGCHNGVLIVLDANSGRNIQKLPIGLGVDAVVFDPAIKTVFTSNKEGTISIIGQLDENKYENRATVPTLPGAKTMALDPARHVVYTVAIHDGQFTLLEVGQ